MLNDEQTQLDENTQMQNNDILPKDNTSQDNNISKENIEDIPQKSINKKSSFAALCRTLRVRTFKGNFSFCTRKNQKIFPMQ